jgi:hypothetical protein
MLRWKDNVGEYRRGMKVQNMAVDRKAWKTIIYKAQTHKEL